LLVRSRASDVRASAGCNPRVGAARVDPDDEGIRAAVHNRYDPEGPPSYRGRAARGAGVGHSLVSDCFRQGTIMPSSRHRSRLRTLEHLPRVPSCDGPSAAHLRAKLLATAEGDLLRLPPTLVGSKLPLGAFRAVDRDLVVDRQIRREALVGSRSHSTQRRSGFGHNIHTEAQLAAPRLNSRPVVPQGSALW
jgi:hypothetical protein